MRVAGVATAGRRHRLQARGATGIAFVVEERPRPRQRRRPEIILVPAHRIAGGVTDPAIDAFDGRVNGAPRRAIWPDLLDFIVACLGRRKNPLSFLPLLKERLHVGRQVLDDGQVFQRADLEPAAAGNLRHVGAAGPARSAIDGHGTGAADADPAGETIRQGRIDMALHEGDNVEHGLARALRHAVGLVAPILGAAPKRH